MKRIVLFIIAMLTLTGVLQEVAIAEDKPQCPTFNLNALGLRKQLSADWKPNNEQDELGFNMDYTGKEWPVSLDLGYLSGLAKGNGSTVLQSGSILSNTESEAITTEVFAGVKKIWRNPQDWSLFLGAGAAWITGRVTFSNIMATENSFSDAKLGWYVTTGGYYTVLKFLNLGIMLRYSDTQLNTVRGHTIQAGGWHYGFLAGVSF